MKNAKKFITTVAMTGALALTALAPAAFAFASSGMNDGSGSWNGNYGTPAPTPYASPVPPTTNNFFGYGGNGYFGGQSSLGDLFVLDRLFSGPNGNGIISPYGGTSLGDLFVLDQLFSGPGSNGPYLF